MSPKELAILSPRLSDRFHLPINLESFIILNTLQIEKEIKALNRATKLIDLMLHRPHLLETTETHHLERFKLNTFNTALSVANNLLASYYPFPHYERLFSGGFIIEGNGNGSFARIPKTSNDAFSPTHWLCYSTMRWDRDIIEEITFGRNIPNDESKFTLTRLLSNTRQDVGYDYQTKL